MRSGTQDQLVVLMKVLALFSKWDQILKNWSLSMKFLQKIDQMISIFKFLIKERVILKKESIEGSNLLRKGWT